ncbi:MAG: nucleoside hydrolase [Marinilabiliaceae bacterium]
MVDLRSTKNFFGSATKLIVNNIPGIFRPFTINIVILLAAFLLFVPYADGQMKAPVKVILDTDMATDVDDVGALVTLLSLEDLGEAKVLAVGLSVQNDWAASCVDAITTFYGRPGIPIGGTKSGPEHNSKYTRQIAHEYRQSRGWNSTEEVPEVIALYRKVLSRQPDNSVTFVTIGTLTNAAALLKSGPCQYSDLNGRELVAKKVQRMVSMAGSFGSERESGRRGREHNIYADFQASVEALTGSNKWPTPVLFSPFKVGYNIRTGSGLKSLPEENIIRRAYELYYEDNIEPHPSYDQCAVHYAVRGFDGGAAEGYYEIKGPGWITLFEAGDGYKEGWNGFEYDANGLHTYKNEDVETFDVELIAPEIEELMKHSPNGGNP